MLEGRYVVEVVSYGSNIRLGRVLDKKEKRYICSAVSVEDAKAIAKAMNVSDSWEPITIRGET